MNIQNESGLDQQWTFVHVSDFHVGSPRSYRFQPAWNENWETARKQIVDLSPEFLLVGGDMTRDGTTHREELVEVKQDLDSLPFPVHIIPGNHEIGNKYLPGDPLSVNDRYLDQYEDVFGPSEWSFVHRGVRFSGFNSFLIGSGLPREAVLRDWLEKQTALSAEKSHVWILHPAIFIDRIDEPDFDPIDDKTPWYFGHDNAERAFLLDLFRRTGTTHVISGHIHCRHLVIAEGIEFHIAPSTAFPQWGDRWPDGDSTLGFLKFEVSDSGLRSEFVALESKSSKVGYGPGGNPPEEGRDYSVSWEKPPFTPLHEK